jgi:ATP-dependent Clp protease ATP-binding subunit ClpC
MFEWLAKQARKAVVLAQEEVRRLKHDYIGTEHLLLGLLRYDEGVAARALSSRGVTLNEAREQVESMVGRGDRRDIGQVPFTLGSKQVLDGALREALRLGHNYVNTEHILLGLTNDPDGIAMHVLSRLGVDPDEIHREVASMIGGQAAERRPAADLEDSKYA